MPTWTDGHEPLAGDGELILFRAVAPEARNRILAFIQHRFRAAFGAEVDDDVPELVGGYNSDGTLVAAYGLRCHEDGFFCERYLEEPIECAMVPHYGTHVDPSRIVEVAHLCAARPGLLPAMVPLLGNSLEGLGFHYLACTATGCLARYFRQRALPAVSLGHARPECLAPAERRRWGRYYDKHPEVIVGDLCETRRILALHPSMGMAVEA